MFLSLGADPEWFLSNGKTPVSAIGKIGGSKQNPLQMEGLPPGFTVQEDNVALEYNIPATTSVGKWLDYHELAQDYIKRKLKELKLKPQITGSAQFSDAELDTPAAWIFGCDPDYCAWTGRPNPRPHSDNPNLRSAGGHIHLGNLDWMNKVEKCLFTRFLDLYVGIPLMILDNDDSRRVLYGKAGALRFKSYGLEYRTPSNVWTRSSRTIRAVAEAAAKAYDSYALGGSIPKEVKEVLDSGDRTGGKTLLEKHGGGNEFFG